MNQTSSGNAYRQNPSLDGGPLLIVEQNISGHRLMYVRRLVTYAHKMQISVLLMLPTDSMATEEFENLFGELPEDIEVLELDDFAPKKILDVAVAHKAERVVIPDGDSHLLRLALNAPRTRQISPSILLMRPPLRDGSRIGAKALLKFALTRFLRIACHVSVFDLVSATDGDQLLPHQVMDPVEMLATPQSIEYFRKEYDLDASLTWFGVFGAVSARKNPVLVLESLQMLPAARAGLIIAGRLDTEIASAVERRTHELRAQGFEIRLISQTLDNQTLDSAIAACDCVVLAHSNEGPSGILSKAVAADTQILCAGAISLRLDVERIGRNARWTILSRDSLVKEMNYAINQNAQTSRHIESNQALSGDDFFAAKLVSASNRVRQRGSIVQVLLKEQIGGAETLAASLHEEWTGRGFKSSIIYLDSSDERLVGWSRLLDFRRRLRRLSPDAVVSHSAIPNVYARIIANRNIKVVTVLHSASDDFADPKLRWAERLLRIRTHKVVAVSSQQADMYQKYFGPTGSLVIIPNGVALQSGSTRPCASTARMQVVTLARVAKQKNPTLWLRVARELVATNEVDFKWYGPISSSTSIDALVDSTSGVETVQFCGPTDEPGRVLGRAAVYFHSADREAHSIAILEAAAAGVPVVCADTAIHGWDRCIPAATFSPGDFHGAVSALRTVVDGIDQFKIHAEAVQAPVSARYSITACADRYLAVLGYEVR